MPTSSRTIIAGIDPGIAITGYGIIKKKSSEWVLVDVGTIQTGSRDPFGQRLALLEQSLQSLFHKHKPDAIAIEKLFFATNAKTALSVGEARGVTMLTAWKTKAPIIEFTPLQIKQALTGYGQATKEQIQKMVKQAFRLDAPPQPDDAADALAVALCCAYTNLKLKP